MDALIMPAVVLITAVIAWRVQIDVMGRRAVHDFIVSRQLDSKWQQLAGTAIGSLKKRASQDDWSDEAASWSKQTLKKEQLGTISPIFEWLNNMEYAAVAIAHGTFHEGMYADCVGVEVINGWERAEPFVVAFRQTDRGDDDLFRHFEELATSKRFRNLAKWKDSYSVRAQPARP